jgi:hypothetical protein
MKKRKALVNSMDLDGTGFITKEQFMMVSACLCIK